ncbi:hypothetical protein [Nitrosomonas sp.]|uniref:hypothetical protein n=1 Tax=Nitrosomonas sp. TaxID=42353 RepID=UPI001D33C3D7|nr:hypothetical protein [Nitrosomonas sp.]MBX3615771.1 hypothetical protein [Nitrosomonas sp.]
MNGWVKKTGQKQCADYQVFLLFWAIFIAGFLDLLRRPYYFEQESAALLVIERLPE